MRLALISQTYPPMVSGISVAVRQLAHGLAERGHAVTVIAASDLNRRYRSYQGGVELIRLRSRPTPARVGQRWVWWRASEMRHILEQVRPQLVHLHDPVLGAFILPRVTKAMGLPLVLTAHALPDNVISMAFNVPGARQLTTMALWGLASRRLPHFDAVITPAGYTARQYATHADARAVVISNGVNTERFRPEPGSPEERRRLTTRFGLNPALPVILHVGRLDHEKRVSEVLQAAARLFKQVDAQLMVVGDGDARRYLEHLSRRLGIESRTVFTGFVSREAELPGIYRLGAVFVIASRIEAEGIVVLEAAASGLPIVAVRATSMIELVEEPGCGYLVEPGDLEALAARTALILQDEKLQRRLGESARHMALDHSLSRSVELHEALYERVLRERSATRVAEAE
jgi:1,2-diacylglycerol 3-alpha-glucosyltransferase